MFDEWTIELLVSLIKNLAVPGNTGFELLALGIVVSIIVWRRRRKK